MNALTDPIYNDENKAREHLESIRWPDGPICPHCGSLDNAKRLGGEATRPGLLNCRDCRKQFSVTVGTVFERSKIPLTKWLACSYLMASSKKGISSHQIHRTLGITYKSAWFMTHRLREAMRDTTTDLLGGPGTSGVVEADETYIGPKKKGPKGRGQRYRNKQTVVALVERKGRVRVHKTKMVTVETIDSVLKANIDPTARLMTDGAMMYDKTGTHFASHEKVNHAAGEYARGDVTTNTVEGFFGILKRGLRGIYQHVGKDHLGRYVDEFAFRYNHRVALEINDAERAQLLLEGISGKRLTYRRTDEAHEAR
jgi:transposase-like protein